jgi:hypothetical protein
MGTKNPITTALMFIVIKLEEAMKNNSSLGILVEKKTRRINVLSAISERNIIPKEDKNHSQKSKSNSEVSIDCMYRFW